MSKKSLTPALRFKGFTNAWEQEELGNLEFFISDGNYGELYPKTDQFTKTGVPFLRVNNIRDGYLIRDELLFISDELHKTLKSGHLETHDILITNRGKIGLIAYVDKYFNNANINAQICLIRTFNKINSKYLH
ncbi:MAG TPA: restriction endonuclease subunit S, partial [Atopostipes sp.]|nr:restriction endonuclease subunit S [Atopostipes sp.]